MKKIIKICLVLQGNQNWIGGIEYTKNMIFALSTLPPDVQSTFELSLLSIKAIDPQLYTQVLPFVKKIFYMECLPPQPLISKVYRIIDRALTGNNDYRYHCFFKSQTFDFVYPFTFNRQLDSSYRYAAWIPDFQHKHLPSFFSGDEIRKRDLSFKSIASNAPIIILSSKTSDDDFHKYFPQFSTKTKVLPFTTYPDPAWYDARPVEIQKKYSIPDRFFLVSNQFWKHKNHMVIFKALKLLRDQSIFPLLACTGRLYDNRHKDYGELVTAYLSDTGLSEQVHLLGLIPRIDQIQLMRRSLAVIQPSLFEGWSTVVEDARCLGKPVILSDIPVHKEQNPPHSVFFNKDSPEDLAQIIKEWWENLSPGPLLRDESQARENAQKAIMNYGNRIYDLARGAF